MSPILRGQCLQGTGSVFRDSAFKTAHHPLLRQSKSRIMPHAVSPVVSGEERTSLIDETLRDMSEDTEFQNHLADLAARGQLALTREERRQRQRSLDNVKAPNFYAMCKSKDVPELNRSTAKTLQLNIGLYCNQACTHCHVESSPKRKEMMDRETADRCLALLAEAVPHGLTTLDITGGAPELNAQFRHLVTSARALGVKEIIDRCNLTVLMEPGQEDLPAFLAENKVRVVASMPCYGEKNVDAQRGSGVFERSIRGLQMLNAHGYGTPGGLPLDLVYNPGGAFLAPPQEKLVGAYRAELKDAHGIVFSNLIALNNMPIKRYADWLQRRGQLDEYMQLLVSSFNPDAATSLMCRDTVSVGWDGAIYDCDFNQQLALGMLPPPSFLAGLEGGEEHGAPTSSAGSELKKGEKGSRLTVHQVRSLGDLTGWKIACDNHCYGCTAGSGSSCGGQSV